MYKNQPSVIMIPVLPDPGDVFPVISQSHEKKCVYVFSFGKSCALLISCDQYYIQVKQDQECLAYN